MNHFKMYFILVLVLLFGFSQAISNGIAAEDGQFPYSVAILATFGSIDSGAVLISDQYILTWAITFIMDPNRTDIRLVLGSNNLKDRKPWEIRVTVSSDDIIMPANPFYDDIVLIKLPEPIQFSDYIQPVQLPSWAQVNETFDDINTTIIGYGVTDAEKRINILHYGNSSTISNTQCALKYSFIQPNQICESSANQVQMCQCDYGGPMLMEDKNGNMTVIGIAIGKTNLECGSTSPVIYTRVTDYLQFIADNTNIIIRDS